jgi:DnaK suppressor protein
VGKRGQALDKQLRERFERILMNRRDELQGRLKAAQRQKAGASLSEAKDEGDRASASMEAEMSVAQTNRAESFVRVINDALRRLEDGNFGECLNCRQQIAPKRLKAIPWSRYCITCQELIDGSH